MRGHKSRKPLLLQGTSLGVQWLGLRAPSAAGPGPSLVGKLDPKCCNQDGGSRVPQLTPCTLKKKKATTIPDLEGQGEGARTGATEEDASRGGGGGSIATGKSSH